MPYRLWSAVKICLTRSKTLPHDRVELPEDAAEVLTPNDTGMDGPGPSVRHVMLSPTIRRELAEVIQRFQHQQQHMYGRIPWQDDEVETPDVKKKSRTARLCTSLRRRLQKHNAEPTAVQDETLRIAITSGEMLNSFLTKLQTLDAMVEAWEQPHDNMRGAQEAEHRHVPAIQGYDPLPVREGADTLETYELALQDLGVAGGQLDGLDEQYEEGKTQRQLLQDQGYVLDPDDDEYELQYHARWEEQVEEYERFSSRVDEYFQRCLNEGIDPNQPSKSENASVDVPFQPPFITDEALQEAIASGRVEHTYYEANDGFDAGSVVGEAAANGDQISDQVADWLAKAEEPDRKSPTEGQQNV